jgi:hypothetical protein
MMNWEISKTKWSWSLLKHCFSISLARLEILRHWSRLPGRDSNSGYPECEAEVDFQGTRTRIKFMTTIIEALNVVFIIYLSLQIYVNYLPDLS